MNIEDELRKWIAVCIFGLFVLMSFLVINLIHFMYFEVKVILFACVLDILIAILVSAPSTYYLMVKRGLLNRTEHTLSTFLFASMLFSYSVMGPTVIDRSLSIYIVEKIDQRGGEVALDAFEELFVNEYVPEYRLVDVRLTEQFSSGTIKLDGECAVLTKRGKTLADTMKWYRRYFLPRKRNLMGEVTDQLTRPFENTIQYVDVACSRASPANSR